MKREGVIHIYQDKEDFYAKYIKGADIDDGEYCEHNYRERKPKVRKFKYKKNNN